MAVAFEAANLFGTRVAETNLASVQYETQQQAGHMNANDPIKLSVQSLASRGPSTYAIRLCVHPVIIPMGLQGIKIVSRNSRSSHS